MQVIQLDDSEYKNRGRLAVDKKIDEPPSVRNSAQLTQSNHAWNFGDRAYILI